MPKFLFVPLMLALVATGVQAQDANYPPPPPPSGAQPGAPQDDSAHFGWADVLRVDPVYVQVAAPRQVCQDQTVVVQHPGNTTAGSILGAVVGGVLGNTVGRGGGRVLTTAVGAVAGSAVGGQVAANSGSQTAQTVTNCSMVNTGASQQQIAGYDVEYRYRGEIYESRLNYDPGERLRVRVSVTPAD
ncbi:glycine zipper 2TM domain-containing protein [Rhodanobacter sp. DHG33]|uniref:glycine zipper 2TM domain-containing protein n=1 Tax=Rhodanobacter sp. DHG33 TaxID=2775921 RepID=UPI00177BD7A4|nr:glycine zipper 2TM domain-containing protein [Rhodanobacter sp. DHG33]MBD8899123.1 glycine zipper 2TM domain-containing protein [Rhodanobacter sp. DHG33]